jgi:hypothetical protein
MEITVTDRYNRATLKESFTILLIVSRLVNTERL